MGNRTHYLAITQTNEGLVTDNNERYTEVVYITDPRLGTVLSPLGETISVSLVDKQGLTRANIRQYSNDNLLAIKKDIAGGPIDVIQFPQYALEEIGAGLIIKGNDQKGSPHILANSVIAQVMEVSTLEKLRHFSVEHNKKFEVVASDVAEKVVEFDESTTMKL